MGDDCLRAVAAAIKSVVHRPGDVVARYKGEEIAVILYDTDLDGAANLAEAILRTILALHLPHIENSEGIGRGTAIPEGSVPSLLFLFTRRYRVNQWQEDVVDQFRNDGVGNRS